jgi:ribosomal protein S18 acetylase RimI-like enzyme
MQLTIRHRDDITPPMEMIVELYRAAQLNRPVDDLPRIARMYAAANVVHTAWDGARLVGILRGWTDQGHDGYICDLAIHPDYQKQGVGRELLSRVVAAHRQVQFVLRASKIARDYYPHIGWEPIENGWFVPRGE